MFSSNENVYINSNNIFGKNFDIARVKKKGIFCFLTIHIKSILFLIYVYIISIPLKKLT